ncbi:SWIB/MDM2 domain-containing protein [Lobosporangium transversale]|uniref:SWIB/MDM2 domain-containing protein n=1 Tax=Lobosporangium transversale TaxID=64571 RepID=A0A1Y2GWH2_9FUNG|nr:SWIB/MDM2 domain-containing protein [Lobosporangium transversale]ORZ26619.1 SWIB/MDM2 domain-containing protein [Lobosporangium transversale]|eukprot:XP_021884382.1 SWIB/MDM2 domain-containing protein [Lobosporangium transversale]
MSVDIYRAKVEELIRQADITTVSARKIRKQIESLTNTSLEDVKKDFDDMVMEIYQQITDDIERAVLNGATPESNGNRYQQQQQQQQQQQLPPQTIAFGVSLPPTSYMPPKPNPVPASALTSAIASEDGSEDGDDVGGESDASFSSVEEDKGSATKKLKTSSSSKKVKVKSKSKAKPSKASSKRSTDDKSKRKTPTNKDGTPKVNNFTRPMLISPTLHDVIGHAGEIGPSGKVEMSRPEVVKQIWVYIKENNLQAPNDKRLINCDSKLKTLFDGQDQISCFTMNKYIGNHLTKPEQTA